MGLFGNKNCGICGRKTNFLDVADGKLCSFCAGLLPPVIGNNLQKITLDEIKEYFIFHEKNKEQINMFNVNQTLGYGTKILIDENAEKFIVTSSDNWRNENPPIMLFSQVTGCQIDIRERKFYKKYPDTGYSIGYYFFLTIHSNSKWFNTIEFQINEHHINYQKNKVMFEETKRKADEMRDVFIRMWKGQGMDTGSKIAVICRLCGATTIPDASGRCEYCDGSVERYNENHQEKNHRQESDFLRKDASMIGAIVGDIVGSNKMRGIKTKSFQLFREDRRFTDDTVMTLAIAEGLMNGGTPDDYIRSMKRFGKLYPKAGYSKAFISWMSSKDCQPYNSSGNGSAMRVSPIGWYFDTLEETENAAEVSAAVTHNHPEGIKGAQATAAAIFLARNGKSKYEIKSYIEAKYDYDLSETLDEIRPTYKLDVSCKGTVPKAIIAFLESEDFEDAIRNAVSLGGGGTLTAITGSIAEAAYGVPETIKNKALSLLDEPLLKVLSRWKKALEKR